MDFKRLFLPALLALPVATVAAGLPTNLGEFELRNIYSSTEAAPPRIIAVSDGATIWQYIDRDSAEVINVHRTASNATSNAYTLPANHDIKEMGLAGDYVILSYSTQDFPGGEYELYRLAKTSGAVPELIMDINPSGGSMPREFTSVGGWLYFTADDGTNGRRLYRTNGTSVEQIATPGGDASVFNLAGSDAHLAFIGERGGERYLFRSNGSTVEQVGRIGPATEWWGGQCLNFDGNRGTFIFNVLDMTSSFTIETWVNPTSADAGTIADLSGIGIAGGFFTTARLSLNQGKLEFTSSIATFFSSIQSFAVQSNAFVTENKWTHVAFVYDDVANTIKIYLDGLLDAEYNMSLEPYPNGQVFFTLGDDSVLRARLDEFRVWDTARTQEQILDNNLKVTTASPGLRFGSSFDSFNGYGAVNTVAGSAVPNSKRWQLEPIAPLVVDERSNQVYFTNRGPGFGVELHQAPLTGAGSPVLAVDLTGNFQDSYPYSLVPSPRGGVAFATTSPPGVYEYSPAHGSSNWYSVTSPDDTVLARRGGPAGVAATNDGLYFSAPDATRQRNAVFLESPGSTPHRVFAGGNGSVSDVLPFGDDVAFLTDDFGLSYNIYAGRREDFKIQASRTGTSRNATPFTAVGGNIIIAGVPEYGTYKYDYFKTGLAVDLTDPGLESNGLGVLFASLGATDDAAGSAVSGIGDVNGDGYEDVAIAAPKADPGGRANAGVVYVALGRPGQSLDDVDPTDFIRIEGSTAGDEIGSSLSGAGDFNGDGFGDILIGAPGATRSGRAGQGEAYLLFGASRFVAGATLSVTDLGGGRGVKFTTPTAAANVGASVSGLGNVNMDRASTSTYGLDDIIIAAPGLGSGKGEAFIVYGQKNPASSITLSSLGNAGVRIQGITAGQRWGTSVAGAGDVNADGYNDVLISPVVTSTQRPMLLYAGAFPTSINLASPPAGKFVRLNLPVGSSAGAPAQPNPLYSSFVAPAGDVNADGFADFLTSDPYFDAGGGPVTGRTYLIYGSNVVLGNNGTLTSHSGDQNNDNRVDGIVFDSAPFGGEYKARNFGFRQGFLGDVNGDGFGDFGLGASFERCCPQTWDSGFHAVMGLEEFDVNLDPEISEFHGFESGSLGDWGFYGYFPGTINWGVRNAAQSSYTAPRTGSYQASLDPPPTTVSDSRLVSPAIAYPTELRFWHRYKTEDPVDGGNIEVSTDGGNWVDLGSQITQGGYDRPGGVYPGWTSTTSGDAWREVVVDLTPFSNEPVIYIAFRYISDVSAAAIPGGWAIDDVTFKRRNQKPATVTMSRVLPDNIVRYESAKETSSFSPYNLPVTSAGDFDGDGASDFVMGMPDNPGTNTGKAAIIRGDASGAEGTYIRWLPTGIDGANFKTLPLAAIGESPDGHFGTPLSRLAMSFQGGGSSLNEDLPSRQQVTLRRTAAPAPFATWTPAPVQWVVQTDRETQSAIPVKSTFVFTYTEDEVAGLDPDRIGVYRTVDDPPTVNSTWIPIASVRDEARRTFTMTREHAQGTLAQDVNGTYSIIEVNDVYDLGDEIVPPANVQAAILAGELDIFDPVVTPAVSGYWHKGSKKLYAASPASPVQIIWKDDSNTVIATQIVNTRWPDESELQLHVSGSPDVDLSNGGLYQTVKLLTTDPDNPAAVDGPLLEAQKKFRANGPDGNRRGAGRSLVLLSTGANPTTAPIFFLPLRTVTWDDPTYGDDKVQYVASEVSEPGLHDVAGGGPFVFFERAYYNNKPGYYDRTARTGPIIPVNTDLDATNPEDNMVVVFYQRAGKIKKALEQTLVTNANIYIPWTDVRYDVQWEPTPSKIIIASLNGTGVLDSLGTSPTIYVQNDRALPGFNPNEEHALISGGIAYALRSDLNITGSTSVNNPNTSAAYTLVSFQRGDGTRGMKAFRVIPEEAPYTFAYTGVAGTPVDRPPPISLVAITEPCANTSTTATPNGSRLVSGSGYVDKNGKLWARNGSPLAQFEHDKDADWLTNPAKNPPVPIVYQYFYPNQAGFYYPSEATGEKPVGTCVPWLDTYAGTPGIPVNITYNIVWPANNPELRAGQTLLTATVGLPDIVNQLSVKVVYDQSVGGDPTLAGGNNNPFPLSSVVLNDPLVERRAFLVALPTTIKQETRGNKIVFPDLEPSLKARLYYDTAQHELVFQGFYVTEDTPEKYVLPNVLTVRERIYLTTVFNTSANWVTAVSSFPVSGASGASALAMVAPPPPAAAKALSSTGRGDGFVTLVFGDNIGPSAAQQTPPNTLISMNVIKVTCPLYKGAVDPIEPDCVFDEKITMRHTADLSGNNDEYEYQWAFQPDSTGTQPPIPGELGDSDPDDDLNWVLVPATQLSPSNGQGAVDFTIKGSSLLTLSDNWITVRYRKIAAGGICGTTWSTWTNPALAEGWIKRVLGRIDPFRQRAIGGGLQTAEDRFFQYNNTNINTMVSMIGQAGQRYSGDVALNCQVLDSFGLIEIYQTVLNRGAKLSINGIPSVDYAPANNALLLAASRISDLYMLLGKEAYADASDPTIGIGGDDPLFGAVASSIHAFMNQVPSLIQEELVLLRGRDNTLAPGVEVAPVFNRFFWNFTRDITGGEVAYALNYNIKDGSGNVDGVINATDAKILYPQGHGDAWGHYLTALKTYMRLLREPNYTWIPRAEAVVVDGSPVSVDYMDERRFAAVVAAKAQAGAEIVSLTYRAAFTENPDGQFTGYPDSNPARAWGLGQWATRAGQGAYLDYVLANAILPPVDSTGTGIQKIDRTTVPELGEVASRLLEIQAKIDTADAGLNPLGLSKEVMLFDIDPTQVVSTFGIAEPHFERVYNKALLALSNAKVAFDYANSATQALRSQADSIADFQNTVSDQEFDYRNRLIEIFGYPYPDDIGPGGAYPAGYNGPDLLHWMLNDPLQVAGVTPPPANSTSITYLDDYVFDSTGNFLVNSDGTVTKATRIVAFFIAQDGSGFVKNPSWTGKRRAPGEIQTANSDLVQAQYAFKQGLSEYSTLLRSIVLKADELSRRTNLRDDQISVLGGILAEKITINALIVTLKAFELGCATLGELADGTAGAAAQGVPDTVIAGLAGGGNFLAPVRGALKVTGVVSRASFLGAGNGFEVGGLTAELAKEVIEAGVDIRIEELNSDFEIANIRSELELLLREEPAKRLELYQLQETVTQSAAAVNKALAEGERILEERIRFRQTTAASVQEFRYKDMAYRIFRNDALQKYRATFDLAAQYAYLAAKAYDYETNFLPGDPGVPGGIYMTNITRSRSLGTIVNGAPQPGGATGDPGLAAQLARMKSNWELNLKPRLGFNNPQLEVNVFSLRRELFRIPDGEEGDTEWQGVLEAAYRPNILTDPQFRRAAIPFSPALAEEPGFVFNFGTTINFGKNYFGRDLGAGDSAYDSTTTSTKMRRNAILLEGYNDNTELSATPRLYFFPSGSDIMRSPTGGRREIRSWRLFEQLIPVPFPLTDGDLGSSPDLIPRFDSLSGEFAERRRFGLDRTFDSGDLDLSDPGSPSLVGFTTRLVGRSAWNTQWTMIIPAGTMLADRDEAVRQFIEGEDGSGGVTDIQLSFETYAFQAFSRPAGEPKPPEWSPEDPPSAFDFAPVLGRSPFAIEGGN